MSSKLVAHAGMDALTHIFEAYVSTIKTEFTDALAIKSIEMIKENLVESYNKSKEGRNKIF